jgi:asparagine synthase (glutamine-hydrolysing)
MFSADGNFVIIYNGEVYNFKEIATELDVSLKTTSDTEVILEAYQKWGKSFVNRLNGMFSIVIYSQKEDELFICRDRLGIKPLYYFWDGANFIFASELKAILALRPAILLSLNKSAVQNFLLLGYVPEPQSICNEINKFPSGSLAILSKGNLTIESWWQPEDQIKADLITSEQDAQKELKRLVTSSVGYRMISDVPFGTFLSGGIDSSLVTAVAQQLSPNPINTFSIGFKEGKYNEAHYAKAVSDHLGTNHHEFTVTEQDAMEQIDRMVIACDEPFADSSAIPTMLVSKLARQHVTMTLSGDGGDELFLGYGSYRWAKRMSNPLIRALNSPINLLLNTFGNNRIKRAAEVFKYSDYSKIRSHIFSQENYYYSHVEIEQLLNYPVSNFSISNSPFKLGRKLTAEEEQALFDIRYYLKDDLLTKVDRATMQFSLETRVPLLDYRIVEFALNLDPNLKYKDGISKYLLKKVLYEYIPKELFDRPKWGFSIPMDRWLQNELNYLIDQYTSKEKCEQFGLIHFRRLAEYVKQFRAGKTYYYNRIWQIIVLHKFLDKTGLR